MKHGSLELLEPQHPVTPFARQVTLLQHLLCSDEWAHGVQLHLQLLQSWDRVWFSTAHEEGVLLFGFFLFLLFKNK